MLWTPHRNNRVYAKTFAAGLRDECRGKFDAECVHDFECRSKFRVRAARDEHGNSPGFTSRLRSSRGGGRIVPPAQNWLASQNREWGFSLSLIEIGIDSEHIEWFFLYVLQRHVE